jgi:hypothetical protein
MNKVERAARAAQAGHNGQLTPLQRVEVEVPVLCTPAAWVGATAAIVGAYTALYAAGNAVSDYVGEHGSPEVDSAALSGKSGRELLSIRQHGFRR